VASPPFTGADVLEVMAAHRAEIAIVTLAPELDGGLDLVRDLVAAGHIVSLGHSGATYEEALAAIAAGASHATHLFNRMTPMSHRAPGLPGAVLQSERVCAELICDGFHVHPALVHMAVRAKGADRVMAITDGTAGSGLPPGSRTHLGDRTIVVTERTAELEDGTLAGSVITMDRAFRTLVQAVGLSLVEAARLCASTPARQLGLGEVGHLAPGARADLVVLDRGLAVEQTFLGGVPWRNQAPGRLV
jgi:N-acetylglucosamine-6-phosphate deacetylase